MYDDSCKLTHWAYWLYFMQFPLENRENKNSRNVCLSQIRENIFSRKFLLIQYIFHIRHISTVKFYDLREKCELFFGIKLSLNCHKDC